MKQQVIMVNKVGVASVKMPDWNMTLIYYNDNGKVAMLCTPAGVVVTPGLWTVEDRGDYFLYEGPEEEQAGTET